MKLSKKNIIHLCVLTGIYLLFVLALTRFKYAYGSELSEIIRDSTMLSLIMSESSFTKQVTFFPPSPRT